MVTSTYRNTTAHAANYYTGTTDTNTTQGAGWTLQNATFSGGELPTVYGYGSGTVKGFMFYLSTTSNIAVINLDSNTIVANLGHP
jgi:hypothetical protein